jgi:hypothetical protein
VPTAVRRSAVVTGEVVASERQKFISRAYRLFGAVIHGYDHPDEPACM